jgi:hypothetical protein
MVDTMEEIVVVLMENRRAALWAGLKVFVTAAD